MKIHRTGREKAYDINALIKAITSENLHEVADFGVSGADFGVSVGKEVR